MNKVTFVLIFQKEEKSQAIAAVFQQLCTAKLFLRNKWCVQIRQWMSSAMKDTPCPISRKHRPSASDITRGRLRSCVNVS